MVSERDSTSIGLQRCSIDEIIELYARDVDVTLLRQNLRRSVEQRLAMAEQMMALRQELQSAVLRAEAR